jgi:hypothetical protein
MARASGCAEVSLVQFAIKAKFGWRNEENFTETNPTSQRRGGLQFSVPALDVTYELYRPFAVFGQISTLTYILRGTKFESEHFHEGNPPPSLG